MTNFNIFIDNLYNDFDIDIISTYQDTVKMTNYLCSDRNIINKSCLKNYNYNSITFDIVFVDNNEIWRINREYRKKDSVTDVITFAIFADSKEDERFILDSDINLGEILISLDKINEQAKENNVYFKEELYFIIAHGILHLLGFDHNSQNEYNFMVEEQNKAKALVL